MVFVWYQQNSSDDLPLHLNPFEIYVYPPEISQNLLETERNFQMITSARAWELHARAKSLQTNLVVS